MTGIRIELLTDQQRAEALTIYNYYVTHTTATYAISPLTEAQFEREINIRSDCFPAYAIMQAEKMIGYCKIYPYKEREGFDRTGEIGIYLARQYIGQGYGSQALAQLEEKARQLNFRVLVASVTGENEKSLGLFQKMGYNKAGQLFGVGEKFNRIMDLIILTKKITLKN